MRALGFFLFIHLFFISFSSSLTTLEPTQPLPNDLKFDIDVDPSLTFESPRIKRAYFVFQEWKKSIYSDPFNFTANWVGPDVCSYQGVFCAYALDDPNIVTVALIDLNYADLAGLLVPHLGLLTDLGLLHLHTNRFSGIIPETIANLPLLFEFDVSNNHLVGKFPRVVLTMPQLRFLDLRYNEFEGPIPHELFDMQSLDAIILNNNRFDSFIPENIGNSLASTLVFANNKFAGCIPKSVVNMPRLEQVSFANNLLTGCLPDNIGSLSRLTVFDVSRNYFIGKLPESLGKLRHIERFDFSYNRLTGKVSESICNLRALSNFTISSNYFNEIGAECDKLSKSGKLLLKYKDNCFPMKTNQRSKKVCYPIMNRQVDCNVDCRLLELKPGRSKSLLPKSRKKPPPLV